MLFSSDGNLHNFKCCLLFTMVSFTSSFYHHMSSRSLLDFFPCTSSHPFRTPSLKVFKKSDAYVLTSSFTLFSTGYSCLAFIQLPNLSSDNPFFFSQSFLEPFFPHLRPPSCAEVSMESLSHAYILSVFSPTSTKPISVSHSPALEVIFLFLIKPCVYNAQLFFIEEL